jgi:hypothetical protein
LIKSTYILNAAHHGCGNENNMKSALCGRSWLLPAFVILLTGSLFANSSETLYPGWGTSLNGKAVYFSVLIKAGDQVQTIGVSSKISFGSVDLEMAPNSILVVGTPFALSCGTVVVELGTAEISDGTTVASFAVGEVAHSASPYCGNPLPDAPSTVRSQQEDAKERSSRKVAHSAQPSATGGMVFTDFEATHWPFMVSSTMLSSSIVAAQLTHKCLEAGACTFVPEAFHRRLVMLGVGLPVEAGVSYFTYYFKKKGYRWWFVPAALVTVGDVVVSVHAAHYSR